MSKAHGLILALVGFALLISTEATFLQGQSVPAQQTPIPFEEFQHATQAPAWSIRTAVPAAEGDSGIQAPELAGTQENSTALVAQKMSWSTAARGPSSPVVSHTFSRSYFLLNGLHLGMALFDVELTQNCIADHHCREGNPIMPSSRAGQLGISFGTFAYASGTSYWLKKHHSRYWWIAPAAGIVGHSVGVSTGFEHR